MELAVLLIDSLLEPLCCLLISIDETSYRIFHAKIFCNEVAWRYAQDLRIS